MGRGRSNHPPPPRSAIVLSTVPQPKRSDFGSARRAAKALAIDGVHKRLGTQGFEDLKAEMTRLFGGAARVGLAW